MTTLIAAMVAVAGLGVVQPASPPVEQTGQIELAGVTGRIDHMAAEPGRLYIAALGNGSVEVVDLEKAARVRSIGGLKEPQGVAVMSERHRLFVACAGDGTVHAFDTASFEERGVARLGDDADNARIADGLLYVGYGEGAVAALDPGTLEVRTRITLPAHPESFQLEPGGDRAFINTPGGIIGGGGSVVVADRKTGATLATWTLHEAGRNFPMALDGTRLYVACRRPARLLVLDTTTGKVLADPECVGDADDVYADPARSRVYVTGGDGFLDVFTRDADGAYRREQVATAPGARTSLLLGQNLYVAAPARGGRPARIIVYAAKGAGHEVGHP